jgi:hypothetical protein
MVGPDQLTDAPCSWSPAHPLARMIHRPGSLPSAGSSELLGHGEMRFMGAAIGVADAVGEFVGREQAVGFDDAPLGVDPGGLIVPNLMHVRSVGRSNDRSVGSGRGSGAMLVLSEAEAPLPVVGDAGAIGDQLVPPSFLPQLLLGQTQDALGFPEAPLAVALGG